MGILGHLNIFSSGAEEDRRGRRKRIYVAHPLLGDMDRKCYDPDLVAKRIVDVSLICRDISNREQSVLILSPIHMFGFYHPSQRLKPLADCEYVIKHLVDEVWVFGEWETSEGCRMEIDWARAAGIPVLYKVGEYGPKTQDEEVRS